MGSSVLEFEVIRVKMAVNKDEMNPPEWMNTSFFEDVLKKGEENNSINVFDYKIVPGSRGGDHFASVIFRAHLKYTSKRSKDTKNIDLIIKMFPLEDGAKKDLLDTYFFVNEIKIYSDIKPKIEAVLKANGDDTKIMPRLLYSTVEPNIILVFEDLKPLGFDMIDEGLNFEECKIYYKKLAKWHATTMHLTEIHPEWKEISRGLFCDENTTIFETVFTNLNKCFENIGKWPGCQTHSEKLLTLNINMFKDISKIVAVRPDNPWNVISHGDTHFKNMMFKKENGKIIDVLLLDFQISSYISAAYDIIYSLYMVANPETRLNFRDEIIYYYYEELVKTLELIGYKKSPPKLLDLQIELLKFGKLEVIIATQFSTFMFFNFKTISKRHPELEGLDMNDPTKFTLIMDLVYEYPEFQDYLGKMLNRFLLKGFLN